MRMAKLKELTVRYSERLLWYCRDHGNASPSFPMLRQLRSILVSRHSD